MKVTKLVCFFVSLLFFLVIPRVVIAENVEINSNEIVESRYYDVYTLDESKDVNIERIIEMKNTTARLYVSQYSIMFQNIDQIKELEIYEDNNLADYSKTKNQDKLIIQIKLSQPAIGNNTVKKIRIKYRIENFINQSGDFRELMIPVSKSSNSEKLISYEAIVKTPTNYPPLGISKPPVTQVSEGVYSWGDLSGLQNQSLYISFSEVAKYKVKLKYSLKNDAPYSRRLMIPFVPDGAYQKPYISSIRPQPEQTKIDEDGNYLGIYKVPPNTVMEVNYEGIVELYSKVRPELQQYFSNLLKPRLKSRYLTQEKFWQFSTASLEKLDKENLDTARDIYQYVVKTLEYDTGRINVDLKRMGAEWIINNPKNGVCMEFTDLFIAIARERGIAAREVVGYAVNNNSDLTPASFLGDVLHSWPEYLEVTQEVWKPIDPTWGNTTGLDYFNNLDLAHIAFVYHGRDTTYPLPPGVYKEKPKTKDVFVEASEDLPIENTKISAYIAEDFNWISGQKNYLTLNLDSNSNVFLYDLHLVVSDQETQKVMGKAKLEVLAPFEKKELTLKMNLPKVNLENKGILSLNVNNGKSLILKSNYTLRSPFWHYYSLYKGVIIGIIVGLIILVVIKLKK